MSGYPLLLDGTGIRALVVGGGHVAHRKTIPLLESGATVRVVAPSVCGPLRETAQACARLTLVERPYESGDIGAETVVVAATSSRAVNARVTADARAGGRLVNVVDAPEEGNCATVAVHRAGGLVIGVSAGGVPGAAARVRDALGQRFDARYGAAVATLGALRRRLLAAGQHQAWRDAAEDLAGAGFCGTVEAGTFAARAARWDTAGGMGEQERPDDSSARLAVADGDGEDTAWA
jgi:precorrin-2 dehydrogenase / sirohydrochlorin ferrochelatase